MALTQQNIDDIDSKLDLVDLLAMTDSEIRYFNYIDYTINNICDEWIAVYKVATKRLNSGACNSDNTLEDIKELAEVNGCEIQINERQDGDNSFFVGVGFDIGRNNGCGC